MTTDTTVYALRHIDGDKGVVIITRSGLALAGLPADRTAVPAFSSEGRAHQFTRRMARWLSGPIEYVPDDQDALTKEAARRGHDLLVDPELSFAGVAA